MVREGPNPGLHAFLEAMAKLKGALDYFSSNNPGSIELENVRSLHSSGGGQLFREFSEQLKKHSRPVPAIEILNCVAASDSVCGDEVTILSQLIALFVAWMDRQCNNLMIHYNLKVSRASSDDCSISHLPEEVCDISSFAISKAPFTVHQNFESGSHQPCPDCRVALQ